MLMILEAFAKYLQKADNNNNSTDILACWLWEKLSIPAESPVDKVLHCELKLIRKPDMTIYPLSFTFKNNNGQSSTTYWFRGKSPSGDNLLKSLYEYSLSYEQQKWARFVHKVKASDFSCYSNDRE